MKASMLAKRLDKMADGLGINHTDVVGLDRRLFREYKIDPDDVDMDLIREATRLHRHKMRELHQRVERLNRCLQRLEGGVVRLVKGDVL